MNTWKLWTLVFTLIGCLAVGHASAQTGNLLLRNQEQDGQMRSLRLPDASLTFVPPILPREVRKHDLVTIRVDELARAQSEGEMQRRKSTLYDLILKDWIVLNGLKSIKPSPQSDGDPRAQATSAQLFRAEGEIETRESLAFNITAEIVEVRPNGTAVLEAHKRIRINNEYWQYSLSGICRLEDIGPDNVVLSKDVSELMIDKQEQGHVRDSYKRGFVQRFLDRFTVF